MAIVIKKRISLDFLGEEYKDAYFVFRSIPVPDYEKLMDDMPKSDPRYVELATKAKDAPNDLTSEEKSELARLQTEQSGNSKQSLRLVMEYLKKYFHSGKFPDDKSGELVDVTDPNDLDGIDGDLAMKCFDVLTGQETDPKDSKQ